METPRFTHDCERDVFLGHFQGHDLYYADHGGLWKGTVQTVIARYGDDGPEYTSGLHFADSGVLPTLVEAKQRAEKRGLLK